MYVAYMEQSYTRKKVFFISLYKYLKYIFI